MTQPPTKPPYRYPGWMEKFFDLLKKQKIEKVNPEWVRRHIVAQKQEANFINALRFLGLIDDKDMATDRMRSLQVVGEEFTANLSTIIKDSYRALFSAIDVEHAKKEQVVNFFIKGYGFGPRMAREAVSFFTYLAQKAGIPLSAELVARKITVRPPKPPEKRRVGGSRQTPSRFTEEQLTEIEEIARRVFAQEFGKAKTRSAT